MADAFGHCAELVPGRAVEGSTEQSFVEGSEDLPTNSWILDSWLSIRILVPARDGERDESRTLG